MLKIGLLFVIIILFLFSGSLVKQNPAWLQPYRQNSRPVPSITPSALPVAGDPVYRSPDQTFAFNYPPEWVLKTETPGCGPVWFPPDTDKVWVTVCGPYPGETPETMIRRGAPAGSTILSKESVSSANRRGLTQTLKISSGNSTQTFIELPSGTLAIYFTNLDLASSRDYANAYRRILATLVYEN